MYIYMYMYMCVYVYVCVCVYNLTEKTRSFSFSYPPCLFTLVVCILPPLMTDARCSIRSAKNQSLCVLVSLVCVLVSRDPSLLYAARRNRFGRSSAWRRRRSRARNTQGSCKSTKYFFSNTMYVRKTPEGSCK